MATPTRFSRRACCGPVQLQKLSICAASMHSVQVPHPPCRAPSMKPSPVAWRRPHAQQLKRSVVAATAASNSSSDPSVLAGLFMSYMQHAQGAQQAGGLTTPGATLHVQNLTFHPPGAEQPLLSNVSMQLPANSLGLIIGRSGSGKTTLLQVLAGLSDQTAGEIMLTRGSASGSHSHTATAEERMQQVGLVFQFPERHFLGEDLFQELTFTWPRSARFYAERQALAMRVQQVMSSVGLSSLPLHLSPLALSGGQQRRLALAIQLIRQPAVLLLDEPLAGLDWQSRAEVVALLRQLKQQCSLLVVSHDLRELSSLVDSAWEMKLGGAMVPVQWPPPDIGPAGRTPMNSDSE
mmetsp:Transcript_10062/g.21517  ORF Transcript_10062/g.21517 Transcript_10062/m.21517 type:complete len:350 (+) Transcript_10062:349-1398(+)